MIQQALRWRPLCEAAVTGSAVEPAGRFPDRDVTRILTLSCRGGLFSVRGLHFDRHVERAVLALHPGTSGGIVILPIRAPQANQFCLHDLDTIGGHRVLPLHGLPHRSTITDRWLTPSSVELLSR